LCNNKQQQQQTTMSEEDKANEEAELAEMLDLTKKKKKKKKKDKKEKESGGGDDAAASSGGDDDARFAEQRRLILEQETAHGEENDTYDRKAEYTYEDMLDRVMGILHAQNPDLIEKKRRTMKPPQLTRVGTKKTLWVNFQEICTMMQRSPQHVFQFFMAELGTEGSIDGNQRLVIRGKYVPKYIESLLRKYIVEYVTCQMCRSPNTELTRDAGTRLNFCTCRDCGSQRSVAQISSGYHATSRADRRAARNAAG
jgi:translation initiation factor 2 subunit 2